MAKFRKKPVVIEAIQLPIEEDADLTAFHKWSDQVGFYNNYYSERHGDMLITTLEGDMAAHPGDWIIKGVAGEFYPCKPDIFELTYEPV